MKTDYQNINYRPEKGKYQIKLRTKQGIVYKVCDTLEQAVKVRNQLIIINKLDKVIDNKENLPDKLTISEGFKIWYETEIVKTIKPGTTHMYHSAQTILSKIGCLNIDQLNHDTFQAFINELQEENDFCRDYISSFINKIKRFYSWCIRKEYATKNPAIEIKFVYNKREKKKAMTIKEEIIFLKYALVYEKFYYIAFRLIFETGIRRAECAALKFLDFNFNKCEVVISHNISGKTYTTTKTENIRTITITRELRDLIYEMFIEDGQNMENFVFRRGRRKNHICPNVINAAFRDIKKLAGIREDATPHTARHTFATILIEKGVDIPTVQKLGGWANPNTLLKIYAETSTPRTKSAMDIFHKEQAF